MIYHTLTSGGFFDAYTKSCCLFSRWLLLATMGGSNKANTIKNLNIINNFYSQMNLVLLLTRSTYALCHKINVSFHEILRCYDFIAPIHNWITPLHCQNNGCVNYSSHTQYSSTYIKIETYVSRYLY